MYTKACYRSEAMLPKDVDKFLTYELETLSNKTSEKSALFYLIFSDKCCTLKISHFPGFSNLIGFNHSEGRECNKPCYNDKCLIAKLCSHCYCDVPGLEMSSVPATPSAGQVAVGLHQVLDRHPALRPSWFCSDS